MDVKSDIQLKRSTIKLEEKDVDFVSCAELGLYLCFQDTKLTYSLIEPLARFLMWANRDMIVRRQDLNVEILRSKGTMLVAFDPVENGPDMDETIDTLKKYGTVGETDSGRTFFLPYADGHFEKEVFDHEIIMRIKREDPEMRAA